MEPIAKFSSSARNPLLDIQSTARAPLAALPFGVANLAIDPDPTSTEQYVTYNQGKIGAAVTSTPLGSKSQGLNRGALSIQGADFLADHGWNYLNILQYYFGADAQLSMGNGIYNPIGFDGAVMPTIYTPIATPKLTLASFEHDAGNLQSVGQSNSMDRFVDFAHDATTAMRSTKTAHGGRASELLNIAYDSSSAHGSPFTYRILSGTAAGAGNSAGNIRLPAFGTIGFYLETKTPGLTAHLAVDDIDGAEKSANRKIIADGKWHKYYWDMQSGWSSLTGQSDGQVAGPFTFDSIFLSGKSNASVRIDDVFFAEGAKTTGGGDGGGAIVGGSTGTFDPGNLNLGGYGGAHAAVGTVALWILKSQEVPPRSRWNIPGSLGLYPHHGVIPRRMDR